jgi:hypothetical protein
MTVDIAQTRTEVGNYFVSNYPPFSQWKPEFVSKRSTRSTSRRESKIR